MNEHDENNSPLMGHLSPDSDIDEITPSETADIPRKIAPVFFVLDCSGSMAGPWIACLNEAMRNAIETLKTEQYNNSDTDIQIAVLRVNSGCRWLTPTLMPINDILWIDLPAGGLTSLGEAFNELNEYLSRRNLLVPNARVLSPFIVFTADGTPTDFWVEPLESLKQNRWYQQASKVAIRISDGAEKEFFTKIVGNPEFVFDASSPESILTVFQETMSLFHRSSIANLIDYAVLEDIDENDDVPLIFPSIVETSYGRAKCRLLKLIRKAIADANNIPYEITECQSTGHCNGACPACDQEAAELSKLLSNKAATGQIIHMPDTNTALLDEFLPEEAPATIPTVIVDDISGWIEF